MSKFSVKKPLTVFVAVIAILVLGVISYTRMTPDLLPNMDFPYVMIMTTYPGASPEKVEAELTTPMEQSMSTLEHIKEISSTSSENYSMLLLEFEEDVNLDTIGVDIQQQLSALSAGWNERIGTPYMLKINPSMLPIEVAAVSMKDMTTAELTEFVNDTLNNKLEGIPGVARISTSGMVEQELHIILDQEKIDTLNLKIAGGLNDQLDEAAEELRQKKAEVEDALSLLEEAKDDLAYGKETLAGEMAAGEAELSYQQAQLISTKAQMDTILNVLKTVRSGMADLKRMEIRLERELDSLLDLQDAIQRLKDLLAGLELPFEETDTNTASSLEQPKAELSEYDLIPSDLQDRIDIDRDTLKKLKKILDILEDSFNLSDLSMESLEDQLDELIATMTDASKQIDSGMLQMKDAAALLSEQKTLGILELSEASTQIAVNNASLTAALTQIESGLDTLESNREDALEKADLNEILTMDMISSILTAQNFSMPAGYVEQDGIRYMVSVGEEITDAEEIQNLLLLDMGLEEIDPIRLSDVAMILVTDNRNESYTKLNGQDGILLSFEKQSNYSTAEATDNIELRFRELEDEYPGLQFVSLMNQGDYIYLIVDSILSSLLLGALFSVLILFLFLKDLRPTFITLCSIPISVIFAIVLMYFSGVTINMISLSGLAVAVGMLVDNSVVVIENIYRLRAKGANAVQAAVSGAQQVAGSVTASTLTTVFVFLPIVFVEGITRQLFTDLALTMAYALLASLIIALTLVPAMASGMLRKEKQTTHRIMDKVLSIYGKLADWVLRHKLIVISASLVLLVASAGLCLLRGFTFMPEMDMPNVNISVSMPKDSTMEEASSLADEVLKRIDTLEGIETVGAMMSSASSGTSGLMGSGDNHDVTIYITLSDQSAKGSAIGKQITELCADLPCEVTSSSAMMDMSALGGSGISLQLYSNDTDALQSAAAKAAGILEEIDGVDAVDNGLEDVEPALHIQIDRDKAMSEGLTVAQIYMELASALQDSTTMSSLELNDTSTAIIIEKQKSKVPNVDGLRAYTFEVTKQDGSVSTVALNDIAEIREGSGLNSIQRLNQRRYLTVSAELKEGYNVTLVTDQAEQAIQNADLGDGISYVFAGENETIMESMKQLILMLGIGILLVYLVMVAQFQSLKSPFIVMFTIPLAFTGGFLALLLCGMEISVISLIGFIMLTGIIVNNGIVLVDYINQLRLEGMERREAIIEAGKTRMRPILMTSITTILGLFDMALSRSAGTSMMQPIAVVCIGGLVYATIMTLFVIPCIYDIFSKKELHRVREEDLEILDL